MVGLFKHITTGFFFIAGFTTTFFVMATQIGFDGFLDNDFFFIFLIYLDSETMVMKRQEEIKQMRKIMMNVDEEWIDL